MAREGNVLPGLHCSPEKKCEEMRSTEPGRDLLVALELCGAGHSMILRPASDSVVLGEDKPDFAISSRQGKAEILTIALTVAIPHKD